MSALKKARVSLPAPCDFPEGDTLGVVLSFLDPCDILRRGLYRVSREWMRVLCQLPHAWHPVLNMYHVHKWTRLPDKTAFAWHNVEVRASLSSRSVAGRSRSVRTPETACMGTE